METVASEVLEFVKALNETAVDSQLARNLGDKARSRAIVGGNVVHLLNENELVGSKILKVLNDSRYYLRSSSGIAHVLYAPSSTGKTTALMHFMKHNLEARKAPAIMVSGQFPGRLNYLSCMATALGIKKTNDVSWIKSLLVGLLPRQGETLKHAPVLILDEFNSAGLAQENIMFADAFARYIYGKGISVIFVTQNEALARDICGCNAWQKIGPFPGLTIPDRISEPLPPKEYDWKDVRWDQLNLTRMIERRPKYKGKFSGSEEVDDEGKFVWLKGIGDTTIAFLAADYRLASTLSDDDSVTFEDGFFDF